MKRRRLVAPKKDWANKNSHAIPLCVFCRRSLRRISFTPDKFGGHATCFPCNCNESATARGNEPWKSMTVWVTRNFQKSN